MSREQAIARIEQYFDDGGFFDDLARRVAYRTESQEPDRGAELCRYLNEEMRPQLQRMGFSCRIMDNPEPGAGPFLVAHRHEADDLLTLFTYGHGDVIRGYDDQWQDGLSPWRLIERGGKWYGRGSADNKGQHTINLAALEAVLEARGRLGFNVVCLIEMGEESGSPGLRAFCEANAEQLRADVVIASDGPRLSADRATLYMGSRGVMNFDLSLNLRDGGHHSGNWGGLLANPGIILTHPDPRTLDHQHAQRADPGRRLAAGRDTRLGPRRGARSAGGPGRRRLRDRSGMGRAGPECGREGARLAELRGSRVHLRHARPAGQRRSAQRPCPLSPAFRAAARTRRHHPGPAGPSG